MRWLAAAAAALALAGCLLPEFENVSGSGDGPAAIDGAPTIDAAGSADARHAVTCVDGTACGGGPCVDGYCCDTACTGTCRQCDRPGLEGLCSTSAGGTDPDGECGGHFCAEGAGACAIECTDAEACKETHVCVANDCRIARPRQEAVGFSDEATGPAVLELQTPTGEGSTLVVVASLAAVTQRIQSVTDSAGNAWMAAVFSLPVSSAYPTLEIWFVTDAHPVTSLTVTATEPRDTVVHFSEWVGLRPVAVVDGVATAAAPAAGTAARSGAVLVTGAEDVVITAVAPYGTSNAVLAPEAGFTPLAVATYGYLDVYPAYRVAGPGTYEATWTLIQDLNWVGCAVALRAL